LSTAKPRIRLRRGRQKACGRWCSVQRRCVGGNLPLPNAINTVAPIAHRAWLFPGEKRYLTIKLAASNRQLAATRRCSRLLARRKVPRVEVTLPYVRAHGHHFVHLFCPSIGLWYQSAQLLASGTIHPAHLLAPGTKLLEAAGGPAALLARRKMPRIEVTLPHVYEP